MADRPPLRLFAPGPTPACLAAARELLRPPPDRPAGRVLEPYSRAWFEQLELTRYSRAGAWLPRVLEFTRHRGESLLVLGPGLGTDALQYHRHGTRVTIAVTPADDADAVRRNVAFRGSDLDIVAAPSAADLPFPRGAFDLAYLNALFDAPPPAAADELYRVLKPGGKLFALFPARYDLDHWQRRMFPLRCWYRTLPPRPTAAHRTTAAEVRRDFTRFADFRFAKRHLRRAELPHALRFLPTGLLERVAGRVLATRMFKPVSAALAEAQAA